MTDHPLRVALLGLGDFERETVGTCLRLARRGDRRFVAVGGDRDADLLIADADDAAAVQRVVATRRVGRTLFIGAGVPRGAVAAMRRPIDPLNLIRGLETLAAATTAAAAPRPATVAPTPLSVSVSAPLPASVPTPVPAPVSVFGRLPSIAADPGPKALLVDASAAARQPLQSRLAQWGVRTDCVGSSGEAIERCADRIYDLVFIDVELGDDSDLDGLALCRRLQQQHPLAATRRVLCSAQHGELDRVRGTLAGCDAYLGKPLQPDELDRLMRRSGLAAVDPARTGPR